MKRTGPIADAARMLKVAASRLEAYVEAEADEPAGSVYSRGIDAEWQRKRLSEARANIDAALARIPERAPVADLEALNREIQASREAGEVISNDESEWPVAELQASVEDRCLQQEELPTQNKGWAMRRCTRAVGHDGAHAFGNWVLR